VHSQTDLAEHFSAFGKARTGESLTRALEGLLQLMASEPHSARGFGVELVSAAMQWGFERDSSLCAFLERLQRERPDQNLLRVAAFASFLRGERDLAAELQAHSLALPDLLWGRNLPFIARLLMNRALGVTRQHSNALPPSLEGTEATPALSDAALVEYHAKVEALYRRAETSVGGWSDEFERELTALRSALRRPH
jgi:hypothetical protein